MATVVFNPDRYYSTIGEHPPAISIRPGVRVETTTVDARGVDGNEHALARGPNPMTGPFYVEGAQPGDTLSVKILKIAPNRSRGWTRKVIATNVLEPDYLREVFARESSNELIDWLVNLNSGTGQVQHLEGNSGFPEVQLDPMIGCLGVSPSNGVATSTATSGPHGGNMDYVGVREGATLYFPVAVPGALFFLGDVHALQGHGEITGTGIEISSDVAFQFEIVREWHQIWPRGEDPEYLFAMGNVRPLDQAIQHATSEMSRWLCDDLGADLLRVHTMMGQCVRYDLGNVYNPAYTMVCKISRADLRSWGILT